MTMMATLPGPRQGARRAPGLVVAALVMLGALPLGGAACEPKVPIVDVGATFAVAEATWFEAEETLFVFYRVDVVQGLSSSARMELGYVTDTERVEPAPLASFAPVHEHVAVDCGARSLCGSWSLRIADTPRNVTLRLRYHEDGDLTLAAPLAFTVVQRGDTHTNRSAIVYGVFDEENTSVQWRLRHQFPAVRNPDATALGLRRRFVVDEAVHGDLAGRALADLVPENTYAYGALARCPGSFSSAGFSATETNARAAFAAEVLPVEAGSSSVVCATATVFDATGAFATVAFAQKNPEVGPAMPRLRSPIAEVTPIDLFLELCAIELTDEEHRAMQLQRLLQGEGDVVCVDDFDDPEFVIRFARRLQDLVDETRVVGNDMVFRIGLHRPENQRLLPVQLETALSLVIDEEDRKSSPRLVGAFVFDSAAYLPSDPRVARHAVWCPSGFGGDTLEDIPDVPVRGCAVVPLPPLTLGPLSISSLPILPTRRQFRTFVDTFGVAQAGRMLDLEFVAPVRTPLSFDVDLDGAGVATFFNNEAVTTDGGDAFSFCFDEAGTPVVFLGPAELSELPLPLELLPEVHAAFPQERYPLGLAWDSPFLMTMEYEVVAAGAVTAVGFTVPFGLATPAEGFEGSPLWFGDEVDLQDVLLRCDRFCRHPTFDSAGVYNARNLFDETYRNQCYVPRFPRRSDGGFPDDP
jgi:hypothetical protein